MALSVRNECGESTMHDPRSGKGTDTGLDITQHIR